MTVSLASKQQDQLVVDVEPADSQRTGGCLIGGKYPSAIT
jgi:hypothetical protein